MFFDSYGPFVVARVAGRVTSDQKTFWAEVRLASAEYDYRERELEQSFGCYVFALRNGQRYKPSYVGMTMAESSFKSEIFQPHKLNLYNAALHRARGTPVVFFFPLLTEGGSFSKSRNANNGLASLTASQRERYAYYGRAARTSLELSDKVHD